MITVSKVTLQVTSTYDQNRNIRDISKDFETEEVEVNHNLIQKFLELARTASKDKDWQNLVISFPNDDAETIRVEVYNGYRG
jgi:CRISPR/Cas system endoribonuclease Cas6 (RAMP superfamily)